MIKYDIHCPVCCGVFHETTGRYRDDRPATGDMFDSKQEIKDAGWTTFPQYDSTEYADVCSPSCGAMYLDSMGRVQRMQANGECEYISDDDDLNAQMDLLMREYDAEVPPPSLSPMPNEQLNNGKKACPVCGERFKSLHLHIKAKHPEAN